MINRREGNLIRVAGRGSFASKLIEMLVYRQMGKPKEREREALGLLVWPTRLEFFLLVQTASWGSNAIGGSHRQRFERTTTCDRFLASLMVAQDVTHQLALNAKRAPVCINARLTHCLRQLPEILHVLALESVVQLAS